MTPEKRAVTRDGRVSHLSVVDNGFLVAGSRSRYSLLESCTMAMAYLENERSAAVSFSMGCLRRNDLMPVKNDHGPLP